MLLHEPFVATATRLASKVAMLRDGQSTTYEDLHRLTHSIARALLEAGIAHGDRVLVLLDASAAYAATLHAVSMVGAVMVPLPPTIKSAKLAFVADDTRAAVLVTHRRLMSTWLEARTSCATDTLTVLEADTLVDSVHPGDATSAGDAPRVQAPTADDLAALIYTSGTTGKPKAVMLTHRNMRSAWDSVQSYLGLRDDDRLVLALPPTYSYGLYNLLMGLGLGAEVIIETRAAFAAQLARTLEQQRATVFPGVPTLYAALLGLEHFDAVDLSSLRLVTNAAAPLPTPHLTRLRHKLPQARLLSMYGLTECKRVSYLPPEELDHRPASVGRGMPNQTLWLVDDEGRRLPHGSTGELVVAGPHVMQGYWERPEETAQRLRPGPVPGERVLHTGDLFRSDAEGFLYFVARRDDIVKTRGEKVAPREVEDAVHAHPDVLACAVIGVPDPVLGAALVAYVVPRANVTVDGRVIRRHCQALLEPHMVPSRIEIVAELPRTDSGKVRHASLRDSTQADSKPLETGSTR